MVAALSTLPYANLDAAAISSSANFRANSGSTV
jgi:hypothetical protein